MLLGLFVDTACKKAVNIRVCSVLENIENICPDATWRTDRYVRQRLKCFYYSTTLREVVLIMSKNPPFMCQTARLEIKEDNTCQLQQKIMEDILK